MCAQASPAGGELPECAPLQRRGDEGHTGPTDPPAASAGTACSQAGATVAALAGARGAAARTAGPPAGGRDSARAAAARLMAGSRSIRLASWRAKHWLPSPAATTQRRPARTSGDRRPWRTSQRGTRSNTPRRKRSRQASAADERILCLYVLPELGQRRVAALGLMEIADLHQAIRETPVQANRMLALLSKMFGPAERWELRPPGSNPCRGMMSQDLGPLSRRRRPPASPPASHAPSRGPPPTPRVANLDKIWTNAVG
jgi:hypothetical protein